MRRMITKEQMDEIEQLAKDGHNDSLIAFGSDMYTEGIKDTTKVTIISLTICYLCDRIIKVVRRKRCERKLKKKQ